MELKQLFKMQKQLNDRIVKEKGLEGKNLFHNTLLALHVEVGEMSNEWQGFKHWKTSPQPKPNLLEEYVDCLHFFLSIAIQKGWEEAMYLYEGDLYDLEENGLDGGITGLILEMTYHISKLIEKPKALPIKDYKRDEYDFRTAWFLFVALGRIGFKFSWEEIVQEYIKKNKLNHERQENGY